MTEYTYNWSTKTDYSLKTGEKYIVAYNDIDNSIFIEQLDYKVANIFSNNNTTHIIYNSNRSIDNKRIK
jgi:hypothetical protein